MILARPVTRPHCAALLFGLLLGAMACKSRDGGALAHAQVKERPFADVPAPPADGPKLVVLRDTIPVLEEPSPNAKRLGELRAGATIARSKEAYAKEGCEGGFYAVRPRGFVCVGPSASLEPVAVHGLPSPPDLSKPMPYRYARARSENVPVYTRMPSPAEQFALEPDLTKLQKRDVDKEPLGASANDVPLDARGVPTGPPVLLPGGDGIVDGRRTVASFFLFPRDVPPPLLPLESEIKAGALRKGSGIAITGGFPGPANDAGVERRFGVTARGHVVPVDRLRPVLGSAFHGIDLEKIGLPLAFIHKPSVHTYALERGKARMHEEEIERRTPVPLTGKFRTASGVRFEETKDGAWLRSQDIVVVVKRHKMPDFAKGAQKWLDVSIANQTLTAYEGTKPVYATLISSGRDMLKDPETTASTMRGTFPITSKHVTRSVDPREVQNAFDIADAPWVMEFAPGFAIHGMYWSDGVGEPLGFHNIALAPIDAHRLWAWSDPPLPEGWHAVYDSIGGPTTIVFVRP